LLAVRPGPAVISRTVPELIDVLLGAIDGPTDVGFAGGDRAIVGIAPAPPRLLHVTTAIPVVLRNVSTGAMRLFAAGADADVFQPKQSPLLLEFSALGGQALSGAAHFETISPTPISEGLGPEVLVAPGDSRLFTFTLTAPRTVGVGVRGSVDDATTRLLGADGTDLGSGVIHMHHLEAGTYFLTVEVPADGVATLVRPALVGVRLPDDGPPADVQAEYESGEGAE